MKKNIYLFILITAILFLPQATYSQTNLLTNGSFETGTYANWTIQTTQSSHWCTGWVVATTANACISAASPQHGTRDAFVGFDGTGGVATLYQQVTLPSLSSIPLTFKFRAQVNIPNTANQPRTFGVQVRDTSDNVLATLFNYSTIGASQDSGWRTEQVFLNQYFGQTVRIAFVLTIPQTFTGPGQFELDDVVLQSFGPTAASVGVGGKVQNANGYGIGNAHVTFTDSTGETRIATTNNFGYWSFAGVEAGNVYVFQVHHKQYQFEDNPRVITIDSARKDIVFSSSSSYQQRTDSKLSKPKRE